MQTRTIVGLLALFALLIMSACSAPVPSSTGGEAAAPAPQAEAPAAEATAEPVEEPEAQEPAVISGVRTFVIESEASEAAYIATEELFADALTKYGLQPGSNTVRGTTNEIEGRFTLDFEDLSSALGENQFTVDMRTLSTDQFLRDGWIRSDGPRFNQYPVAEFIASAIEGAPESYTPGEEVTFRMVGELTIREITHPKTFEVTARLENDTITGTATTDGLLTEYGIDPPHFLNTLTVSDPFSIEINFVAHATE